MKVKRFNNIWAMGLILFGAILIAFYVLKIFFPEFIIGVAETPKIVEVGTAIQSNKWLLHLFNFVTGYINGYIFTCACCRVGKLDWKGNLIFIGFSIGLRLVAEFCPQYYSSINYINFIFAPFLICLVNKTLSKETFTSTVICFSLDVSFQIMSMVVRNLTTLTTEGNVVTFLILLIDVLIWRIILYFFFNYKNKNKEIK